MTFLECLYYWTFAHLIGRDLGLADAGYRSTGPATRAALIGTAVFMVGEFGNFLAHVLLSGLRENDPPGVVRRRIPTGRMFALVSCPHYFFEIVSWVGFNIALPTTPGLAFLGLGGAILLKWGKERHDRYRVMFSGRDGKIKYPEERRAVIPYIF
jgi:very-long-chain enoyl-CoA reductase